MEIKTAEKSKKELTFEIGSNSDLVLENTITGNLVWTIEKFAKNQKGYLTFPTKFDMIDDLIGLEHRGRIIIRVSMNPEEIIKKVEFGTSHLNNRIEAINKLKDDGFWIVGTAMDGTDYRQIDYSGKIALVVGNEGNGMSRLVRESCDFVASIPMRGEINSLNASVATGIMIYEVVRNRK